jgi:hypothetical protein
LKLKLSTSRSSGSPQGFDDRPLQEFIANAEWEYACRAGSKAEFFP